MLTQSAWFRPHKRSSAFRNLYLVGAGTHRVPGFPASCPRPRFSIRWCRMRVSSPESVRPRTPFFEAVRRGPERPPLWAMPHADAADHAACRAAIRDGSRSFFGRSALLPARVQAPGLRALRLLPPLRRRGGRRAGPGQAGGPGPPRRAPRPHLRRRPPPTLPPTGPWPTSSPPTGCPRPCPPP